MSEEWHEDRACACTPEMQASAGEATVHGIAFCALCRSCRNPADVKVPPPPGSSTQKPAQVPGSTTSDQGVKTQDVSNESGWRTLLSGRPLWQYAMAGIVVIALGTAGVLVFKPSGTAYLDEAKATANMGTYPADFQSSAVRSCGYTDICTCKVRTAMKTLSYQEFEQTLDATSTEGLLLKAALQSNLESVCNDPEGQKAAAT